MRGGRLGSLPSRMAARVVSTVLLCVVQCQRICLSATHNSFSSNEGPYLAILQPEDQFDLFAVNQLLLDLRSHPALLLVWLPCPRADVEYVRHRLVFSQFVVSVVATRCSLCARMRSGNAPRTAPSALGWAWVWLLRLSASMRVWRSLQRAEGHSAVRDHCEYCAVACVEARMAAGSPPPTSDFHHPGSRKGHSARAHRQRTAVLRGWPACPLQENRSQPPRCMPRATSRRPCVRMSRSTHSPCSLLKVRVSIRCPATIMRVLSIFEVVPTCAAKTRGNSLH
jgi:hypothetical protein